MGPRDDGRMPPPTSAARVIGTVVVAIALVMALSGTVIYLTGYEVAFLLLIAAVAVLVTGIGILTLDDGGRR